MLFKIGKWFRGRRKPPATLTLVHERVGGPRLHPRGRFMARVTSVTQQEVSPFGLWCRLTFRTREGLVDKVASPFYGEGTDIGLCLRAAGLAPKGEPLPETWEWPGDIVGALLEINVIWSREHGALYARAILPGEWDEEKQTEPSRSFHQPLNTPKVAAG